MPPDTNYVRQDTDDGAAFLIGTSDETFTSRIKQAAGTTSETPTPSGDDDDRDGGPVTRFTNAFSPLSMGVLEHLGLNGHEIATDVRTRVHELYRNEFPVLKPRFERKCTSCDAEYDERVDECRECGGDVREPDVAEKRAAEKLAESVNKEGQSLRQLAESCEWDQWLNGVPVIVIRHEYTVANGEVIKRSPTEIVKGDPKRLVPVVDENRRIGGYWWACPRCRSHEKYEAEASDGRCQHCDTQLREVYFAEFDESDEVDGYYFEEEVLTFPWAFPRLHGLDGLAPTHHNWLKQLIIDFQDRYAGAFYDPESDRLPNQFIVLHTTNPDAWESRLQSAREGSKEDVYDSPVFTNEYSSADSSTPEVQVVDAMPDELLGQNQDLRDTYKKDIRQSIGITDVYDSDMQDAGGLNNEGLQLEVTDRSLATQMHDYTTGWLDELAKRLGIEDWKFGYIPSAGTDAEDLLAEIEAGIRAEQAGLDARLADGQSEVADGEFEVDLGIGPDDQGDQPGGMGNGPMGRTDDGGDYSRHDYGPEVKAGTGAGDLSDATETLFKAHQHLVWPDLVEQKASEPFWSQDEDMPEFVQDLIERGIRSTTISKLSEHLPATATRSDVRNFFEQKLSQPQGWSLRSLTTDFADEFGITEQKAEDAVRLRTKQFLDKGRELGYEAQGNTDDRLFKWVGPIDDAKTDSSWEILEKTNPDHGGTPRTLPELKRIVQEARSKHFPELTDAEWADGWQDRDTYVEHFD